MSEIKRVPQLTTLMMSGGGNNNIIGSSTSTTTSSTSGISNNNDIGKNKLFGGLLQSHHDSAAAAAAAVATISPTVISSSILPLPLPPLQPPSSAFLTVATTTMSTAAMMSSTLPPPLAPPPPPSQPPHISSSSATTTSNSNIGGGVIANENVTIARKTIRTFRIELELFEPNSESFPQFNYSKLLIVEKRKQKAIKDKANGFADPFEENDDDVARIAKEMELKYGNYSNSSKKKSKTDDLCDKGLGYDESDSFIDNTEAYDEVIPDEVETVEGGFYINSGQLEFKHLSKYEKETEDIVKIVKAKKRILTSSSDDSDDQNDDSESDSDVIIEKEKPSRVTETIGQSRNSQSDNNKYKSTSGGDQELSSSSSSKSKHHNKKYIKLSTQDLRPAAAAAVVDSSSVVNVDFIKEKSIKTTTVKDMLKAKRDNFLKMQDDKVKINGARSSNDSTESSDDDSESEDDEPSQKKHKTTITTETADDSDKLRMNDTNLPDDLSAELLKDIRDMQNTAKLKNCIGKNFHLDEEVTNIFLKIDDATSTMDKSMRNQIYAHIEYQLTLPKYFLLRKAKQLRVKLEKNKIKKAFLRFKKSVADVMPSIIVSYEATCSKIVEQRSKIAPDDLEKMETPPRFPKKKFPWNDTIRNLLYDLYQIRWKSYTVLRTRKETFEDFVNSYLREAVVTVWPSGWMRYDELRRELEKRKNMVRKPKENKKPDGNEIAVSSASSSLLLMSNTNKCLEASTSNTNGKTTIGSSNPNSLLMPKSILATSNSMTTNDLTVTIASCSGISGPNNLNEIGNNKSQNLISIIPVADQKDKEYLEYNKVVKQLDDGQKKSKMPTTSSSSSNNYNRNQDSKHHRKFDKNNSNLSITTTTTTSTLNPITNPSIIMDLISPSKRTDHSIISIISGSPTSSTSSHHSNTSTKTPPLLVGDTIAKTHVITVDNYKNTSDIINTSKSILFNNNNNINNSTNNSMMGSSGGGGSNNSNSKENLIRINSVSTINKTIDLKLNRRDTAMDSGGSTESSDGVEIVGCYQNPKKSSPNIIKKKKYNKTKNMKNDSVNVNMINKKKLDSKSSHSSAGGGGGSSSSSNTKTKIIPDIKKRDNDKETESGSDNKDSDLDLNQIYTALNHIQTWQHPTVQIDSSSNSSVNFICKDIKQ